MNFTMYEIVFLDKLIKSNKIQNNGVIKKSSKTLKGCKEILIGYLEVKTNSNAVPYFCFNDNTNYIRCQLLNFNENWLSNVLYVEKWTLIQYRNGLFYLEIDFFSILDKNPNLKKLYENKYKENLSILYKNIRVKSLIKRAGNQALIIREFETEIQPLLSKTFVSNNTFLKNFQNGITIVSTIKSKSCIQVIKKGNETFFIFIIELKIENASNSNIVQGVNDNFTTTFVIFQTPEANKLMQYYHMLLVKHKFIFQNLFLHTLKIKRQKEIVSNNIFKFIPNKSYIQRCFVQSYENNSLPSTFLGSCINDIIQDDDTVFEFDINVKKGIT
ncbi:hypothetical protein BCR36DRAFT_283739 [Piromyces finnis]|uniref:Uncharacterized protein n=1 Tax=Piromyces finnis TaxID=1754191 RepID=A0A1Y1VEL7_9FUNG|nr:hypothetical protein BCR36DRAFT_283739 [Piromyces finnis]|eukprot:ORX54294.1 hypothetical protein BCR36DRAFT_283739 [Piromyces finnis]